MTFERTKNSARTLVFGVLYRVIITLMPFITRTIIIYKLGTEYAGLSSLFTSVLSVLSASELGIGTAITFCLYEPVAKDRKDEVRALLGLLQKLYWAIGGIILVAGLAVMPFINSFVSKDYPADLNLYVLFAIYLLNSSVSYLTSAYKGVLFRVYQRGDIYHNIHTIAEVFKYVAQSVVLLVWSDYYLFVLILLLSTMLINLLMGIFSKKKYPDLYPSGKVAPDVKKIIKSKVMYLSFHSLTAKLISSADNIIISSLLGLTAVGIYGNYHYVSNALIGFVLIAYGAVRASVGNSVHSESKETNLKTFNALWFGSSWMSSWCAITLLCLFEPFIKLWVGEESVLTFPAMLFVVLYFHANASNQFFTNTYIGVAGLWNKTIIRQILAAVINLGLDVLLGVYFGVAGIVFASFITTILIVYPFDIVITYKYILKEPIRIGVFKMIKDYLWFVVLGALCYVVCISIPLDGILAMLVRAIVCIVLPNGIYLLANKNKEEVSYLYLHIKSLVKKKTSKK